MPTKISERQLLAGVVLLLLSVLLLLNATIVEGPVKLSEKGLAFVLAAVGLFGFAIRAFRKSIHKA